MGLYDNGDTAGNISDAAAWQDDILGSDYQCLSIPLGTDPDNETDVFTTLVRFLPAGTQLSEFQQRPALLWVHGMTDYFFHQEFARFFHSQGYAVYAVDLRKYGRSYRPGQQWYYVSDLAFYFPDLDAVSSIINAHHPKLFPVAHSTGGLIVPLWLDHLRRTAPQQHAQIGGLVLNSPWLDMMYPTWIVKVLRPIVNWLGKKQPLWALPNDGLGRYGRSIHSSHQGEWDFDLNFKPVEGRPKNFGWLRAIMTGHLKVQQDKVNVGVDVLTLCSARSWLKKEDSPEIYTSDAVLDVKDIKKWAPHLSKPNSRVSVHPLTGAGHDVFLSRRPARAAAEAAMLKWLQQR